MNFRLYPLLVFVMFILHSCGSHIPKYADSYSPDKTNYPTDLEKVKSFYLIGDVGYNVEDTSSSGLKALEHYLDSVSSVEDFVVFLGDNSRAENLTSEDPEELQSAKNNLDQQIKIVNGSSARPVFIPGELDWDEKGMEGLEKQEEYLEEKLDETDVFMPRNGCPIQFVDISDEVHLIILDSQWYINNWDDHPTINDDCPEIKTRAAMLVEIETELKKNQNKTTVFALHHPLFSNGIHGGNFYLSPYLKPSEKKLPVPLIGSMAMLLRTSGGLSSQDVQNRRYSELVDRLETISKKWGKVVFASGHDHSLQYLEEGHVKQIVTGAASTSSYAGLRNNGLFAYPGEGFAVFDVFEDGSSWVSFYASKQNQPVLLFQKEVYDANRTYPIDTLPETFPALVEQSVYPERKDEIKLYDNIWLGDGYRDLFLEPVTVRTADLDTLYGGLEPMRMGGGTQTNSLRVKDSLNREYNFRKIKKDPLQFIQAALYKNKPVTGLFNGTVLESLIRGFYTASHPYGFLAVPTLAEAGEVLHTNPELYYLPKQPLLGNYNFELGDDLYMIEERPEEHWLGYESFGAPNHDIQSTEGLFDRLRRDEQYSVNEPAYIRARIFDMLLGDWDRHNDQWRWAEIELENGDRVFEPIPRDRDQVFSNYDGLLFKFLRSLGGLSAKFSVYGEDIENLEAFTRSALTLDRNLVQNLEKETWISQATFLQERLTDEIIEEAFTNLPEEIQGENTNELIEKVKGRRDNLVDIAERYYDHLIEVAILRGTDKDDYIDIERLEDGSTNIRISRNKDGDRDEVVAQRTFYEDQTKEVIVYGLDDDDQFYVTGEGKSDILVRLVGGQDDDLYDIDNGNSLKIYDHRSQGNVVKEKSGARTVFTDDYYVNLYNPDRRDPTGMSIVPSFSYNPDDGFVPALSGTYTFGNLVEFPFTSRHDLAVRYFSRTRGFDLNYGGEFKNFTGNYNFYLGAYYSSPGHTRNFFGFGNDTPNFTEEQGWPYNRIRIEEIAGEAGWTLQSPYGHQIKYLATFESIKVEEKESEVLPDEFMPGDRQLFGGIKAIYEYENYDSELTPTSGLNISLTGGGKMNVDATDEIYGYFQPYLELYNAISKNRKLVLNTKIQGTVNFGNDFEFYQAATLGGNNGLRGYRQQRFSGKQAAAAGGNLIYNFDTLKTSVLPLWLSVFGGYDIGRVWYPGQESDTWHDSYGGGLKANIAEILGAEFSTFKSDEGWRFTFGLGMRF
ncbi:phosphoesterase [Salinimicrobium terrae]|uniref:phosphoesterase n=1 Tax=Salinimicrobium terrae TaxID=470866 RepID=UPI0003FA0F2D|nr:phosphoesterase [Salinimicrobium terrae]